MKQPLDGQMAMITKFIDEEYTEWFFVGQIIVWEDNISGWRDMDGLFEMDPRGGEVLYLPIASAEEKEICEMVYPQLKGKLDAYIL